MMKNRDTYKTVTILNSNAWLKFFKVFCGEFKSQTNSFPNPWRKDDEIMKYAKNFESIK